ncbi:LLM class flavin-dependent oxidoreductase [Nocardioides halotolerans]|uniref:LLM class flavin-dependent oxidoreductase n=1 Tax=Nocardioides halotolerans TaxID=433660 RepID=UPI0003F93AF8|nr:LLM class flavin-dependent oxidoreductase [Nocardioides halotolerans]
MAEGLAHGLLYNTQDPPGGARLVERWAELLDLAVVAEECGFASVHVPEHHGRDDGYLPQPLVACAALAARTRRIKVGTAVTVGPLRHPLHLAEEALVVDVLSGGRLVLAVGLGNLRGEYDAFGVLFEDLGGRFDEFLGVLLPALGGDRVTMHGRHYVVPGVLARPRAVQRPRPETWVGSMSPAGVRRAGRLGVPLLLDPLNTIADLEPLVATYREAAAAAGQPARVKLMRWGWVGDDVDADWWPHVRQALWGYLVDVPRIDRGRHPALRGATSADELDLAAVSEDRLLVGDAATVSRLAAEWCHRLGADHLVVKLQGATGPWGDPLAAAVRRYAEVIARTAAP